MNTKITTTKLLILYFGVRLFSFLYSPVTPLQAQHPINTLVSFLILALTAYLILKKDERGWYIVAIEILLGGSSGYLKFGFISLRTALLLISTSIFFIQKFISEKINFLKRFRIDQAFIITLIFAAGLSALRGFYMNHARSAIFADFIPYLFLLYYFPLRELWPSVGFRELCKKAIFATIFGNALLILLTQVGLSSGLFVLQDSYYHWYRDVALGKITDLNSGYFRLVLNEHLLLIPITLYFIADIIKNSVSKINISILFSLLFILANNLTRIYILALALGILILFSTTKLKRWLIVSVSATIAFILIFVASHTLATRGQSFGLELFGLRLQSIASPQIEDSSMSRMLLLPKILDKIKLHPILGNGLGDNISVYSPIFKTTITTPNFDWGYLEIWAETGLLGIITWLAFVITLFYKIIKNSYQYNKNILIAMLIGLLVLNITSPALFHVFGAILLIILFTSAEIKHDLI